MTRGGPAPHTNLGPNALRGAGPVLPGNLTLPSRAQRAAPAPVSPRSGAGDTTFCKHFFVFYSAGISVSDTSAGLWKAVPKGQPAGLRAKRG